jgi:hypothetical protein
MPSVPWRPDGTDGDGSFTAGAGGWAGMAASWATESRNVARRHEEQVSCDRAAEVEEPIVVARRPADEHVLQHLLDGAGRAAVADEIRAELTVPRSTEGHVVTQDLDLLAALDNRGQRVVGRRRLDGIVEFDVG